MSRRGLVSKSFGPGAPGGPALMPKGEKPGPTGFLPIEEVASTLKVQPSQILEWMQKDQLRGNDAGIKPYDLKKFQLDHQDEIRKAQARALKNDQKTVEKKPSKGGFLSRLFGGKGKAEEEPVGDAQLIQENKRLKEELNRAKTDVPDQAATVQLEDKVRFLEGKLAKTSALESELSDLKRRLAEAGGGGGSSAHEAELERQLEALRRELARSQDVVRETESLHTSLRQAEAERDRLAAELAERSHHPPAAQDDAAGALGEQLESTRLELQRAEERLQGILRDDQAQQERFQATLSERDEQIATLRQELEAAQSGAMAGAAVAGATVASVMASEPNPLVDELLALQETNLARFARLHDLYLQAQAKLDQAPSLAGGDSLSEAGYAKLQSEFETLRVKHQSLLEARETNVPGHQEFVEQLAAARVTTTRLKQENAALKSRLSEADLDGWKQKVDELQQRVAQGSRASDANLELAETELRAVRKSLQAREAQVQKIAGRLQENERALKKALKESTRLTELLIERENRLRDLSTEYEQEYRDKIDNLDRQVSGLQWKLSLREERIASLESEVSELRKGR